MLKQEPKLHSESFDDFKNNSLVSAKYDNEDDYQDIDEKTIAEPNISCRQQVYVNLDKDDQTGGAGKVLLESRKPPQAGKRSSKRADSYKNQYLKLKKVSGTADDEGDFMLINAISLQKHSSARKAPLPLRNSEVQSTANKSRAPNDLGGSHMKQPAKVRGESETSVKMVTTGSARGSTLRGSTLRTGVDLDAQNFSSSLTDNNNN